jgi:hypothetical protein
MDGCKSLSMDCLQNQKLYINNNKNAVLAIYVIFLDELICGQIKVVYFLIKSLDKFVSQKHLILRSSN